MQAATRCLNALQELLCQAPNQIMRMLLCGKPSEPQDAAAGSKPADPATAAAAARHAFDDMGMSVQCLHVNPVTY